MARKFNKDEVKETRKDLPELLETGIEDADKAVLLLEEGEQLKNMLNETVKDDVYDPQIHVARRYKEIKEELCMIQIASDVPGLRHGRLAFVARLQDGRESIDMKLFVEVLLARGVHIDIINAAMLQAKKTGDSFWVKQIEVLK